MRTALIPLTLSLAACCLLSSCRVGMFTADSSQRLEAALRGGEADGSIYSDPQWKLTDEAVMELTLENGHKVYYLPVEFSAKAKLDSWVEYRRTTTYGLQPTWGSGKGELVQLPAKKIFLPLRLRRTEEQLEKLLMQYGIKAKYFSKDDYFRSPSTISYLQSDFPPSGAKMRRIAIPHLEQALKGKIEFFPSHYYTKPTGGVRAAEMTVHLLVDIPVALVGFTLGTLYENLFGWMHSDEGKASQ